ncbi:MAG: hypothetical protein K8R59_15705 [Thermoanaerobaculales bacterium]|nr:hypothetical protein [Thermoanaerobaculales bacterium]
MLNTLPESSSPPSSIAQTLKVCASLLLSGVKVRVLDVLEELTLCLPAGKEMAPKLD